MRGFSRPRRNENDPHSITRLTDGFTKLGVTEERKANKTFESRLAVDERDRGELRQEVGPRRASDDVNMATLVAGDHPQPVVNGHPAKVPHRSLALY
jgi:hypothetical protein